MDFAQSLLYWAGRCFGGLRRRPGPWPEGAALRQVTLRYARLVKKTAAHGEANGKLG